MFFPRAIVVRGLFAESDGVASTARRRVGRVGIGGTWALLVRTGIRSDLIQTNCIPIEIVIGRQVSPVGDSTELA